MQKKILIGNLIKQKLKDDERSMAWLAKKVNCDKSNFCKKLKNDNIELDLLLRISRVLKEDFFAKYSEILALTEQVQSLSLPGLQLAADI